MNAITLSILIHHYAAGERYTYPHEGSGEPPTITNGYDYLLRSNLIQPDAHGWTTTTDGFNHVKMLLEIEPTDIKMLQKVAEEMNRIMGCKPPVKPELSSIRDESCYIGQNRKGDIDLYIVQADKQDFSPDVWVWFKQHGYLNHIPTAIMDKLK